MRRRILRNIIASRVLRPRSDIRVDMGMAFEKVPTLPLGLAARGGEATPPQPSRHSRLRGNDGDEPE
jgi:hypothetical protein